MTPKQVGLGRFTPQRRTGPPPDGKGTTGIWITITMMFLLMGLAFYLIWERASNG